MGDPAVSKVTPLRSRPDHAAVKVKLWLRDPVNKALLAGGGVVAAVGVAYLVHASQKGKQLRKEAEKAERRAAFLRPALSPPLPLRTLPPEPPLSAWQRQLEDRLAAAEKASRTRMERYAEQHEQLQRRRQEEAFVDEDAIAQKWSARIAEARRGGS